MQYLTTRPSLWFLFASLIISAVMMRPSFAGLLAIIANACILLMLRKSAMNEASKDAAPDNVTRHYQD